MNAQIERKPTLSLSMVSRDLPAGLADVAPHVDEVIVTLFDCDDAQLGSVEQKMSSIPELAEKNTSLLRVSADSHPFLYLPDVEETYEAGESLAGESYPGPFSGSMFMADWAEMLNLGWSRCSAEWRLALHGNELMIAPETLIGRCWQLDEQRRDVAHVSVESESRRSSHPIRLARNLPAIRWEGTACSTIESGLRPAVLDGNPKIVPSKGSVLLTDLEAFRILYAEARSRRWNVHPVNLLHMAKTAKEAGMPDFAPLAIDAHLENSLYPEERAWACALRGELLETDDASEASRWYERSLDEHPGWKSALRLCRSRFAERKWRECVEAYRRATELQDRIPLVDDGCESFEASLVHAAASLHELGLRGEASAACQTLREIFPTSKAIATMCSTIES
jgi:hypothetical protein